MANTKIFNIDPRITLGDGAPIYNVIKDYAWCAKKLEVVDSDTIPWVEILFYQQDLSSILTQIGYWGKAGGEAAAQLTAAGANGSLTDRATGAVAAVFASERDPYQGLYRAKPAGSCKLPYYSSYHHVLNNTWGENKGIIGGFLENTLVQAAKAVMPSAGILSPKAWEGLQTQTIPIDFILLNTAEHSNINANMALIKHLLVLNAPLRVNEIAQLPPVICSVRIPGIRWMPVAYISNLAIENLGQMTFVDGSNVPEAYKITIAITEAVETSRQILLDEDRIKAISTKDIFGMNVLKQPEQPELSRKMSKTAQVLDAKNYLGPEQVAINWADGKK